MHNIIHKTILDIIEIWTPAWHCFTRFAYLVKLWNRLRVPKSPIFLAHTAIHPHFLLEFSKKWTHHLWGKSISITLCVCFATDGSWNICCLYFKLLFHSHAKILRKTFSNIVSNDCFMCHVLQDNLLKY